MALYVNKNEIFTPNSLLKCMCASNSGINITLFMIFMTPLSHTMHLIRYFIYTQK